MAAGILSRAIHAHAAATRISYLAPGEPEATVPGEYPPFDEKVALMRLDEEFDELDYSDLEFEASPA